METKRPLKVAEFFNSVNQKMVNIRIHPIDTKSVNPEKIKNNIASLDEAIEICQEVIELFELAKKHDVPVYFDESYKLPGYEMSQYQLNIYSKFGNASMFDLFNLPQVPNITNEHHVVHCYELFILNYSTIKSKLEQRLEYILNTDI